MKNLVALTFALTLGAVLFGFAGHSHAYPASTAALAATQAEALKTEATPVRYYTRCYRRWGCTGWWSVGQGCYRKWCGYTYPGEAAAAPVGFFPFFW